MEPRQPNVLDQGIYRHWSLPDREPWKPKGDTRIAFVIYLYLERFEATPPSDAIFDRRHTQGMARFEPYHRAHAAFEYGNRVGIFRVLDLLDAYGLRASVAANTSALTAYPFLVEQMNQRNYEFLAHGEHASRMITSAMPEDEQRRIVAASMDAIESATGKRPQGWMSQDYGQSTHLPQILADMGIQYLCDFGNDEEPYLTTTNPGMVSVPNPSEWNDVEMLLHRKLTSEDHARTCRDAFDMLYRDGEISTRFFGLHIHPWMIGQPARFKFLEDVIGYVGSHSMVWNAAAGEVAENWLSSGAPRNR
jgi:peptidoglycan/xylan/chitin deacetylase (PgdA/CDA1 family)